jgi:hypothetical protein
LDDTPTAKQVRQVLGAVSETRAMTVAKLRGARGRKYSERANVRAARVMPLRPEVVALARGLRWLNEHGRPFAAASR